MSTNLTNYVPPAYQQLPQTTKPWEVGPIAGTPAPLRTFPAASGMSIAGAFITPSTTPTKVMGGPLQS